MLPTSLLSVTTEERATLNAWVRSQRGRAADARRARIVLLSADGCSYSEIAERVGCSAPTISRWRQRFLAKRVPGLRAQHRGSTAWRLTARLEARILNWTRKPPTDGTTHWSTRRLARKLGIPHTFVARTWRRAGLQPHRLERYLRSTDPDFETKAADIIGLYLHPPQHAAVFCVDEKTAIQALDRRDPRLPLSPGRAERHGFEYVRHGTAVAVCGTDYDGQVLGRPAARHTSAEFVQFLGEIVASQSPGREIHIIADNLSAHKTAKVTDFLDAYPNVTLHYTPTYSSWLNQVELWFSKLTRDVLAAESSRRSPTSPVNSVGTSTATTARQHRCAGHIQTPPGASHDY